MLRTAPVLLLLALPAFAAGPAVPRESFANARVSMMVRAQAGRGEARLAELEVVADGARLRAHLKGEPQAGEFWVDGLSSPALHLENGKVAQDKRYTLEHALQLALAASPALGHANTDRVAGHPCKIVSEELPGGVSLTRCIWRGLPLSVELHDGKFTFNAAATLVEENAVTVADLQPPQGAPAAPASMSAGR